MPGKQSVPPSQIVDDLRSDDRSRFERGARALEAQYSASLYSYLCGRGLSTDDAADVLNRVLYRAIRKIDQVRRVEKLTGWLFRLAHSAAMDWHRARRRRVEELLPEEAWNALRYEASAGGPEVDDPTDSASVRLQSAMECLQERDRDVLSAIANDLTNEELAEILGVSAAHARVLRHRAVERLRREYTAFRPLDVEDPR